MTTLEWHCPIAPTIQLPSALWLLAAWWGVRVALGARDKPPMLLYTSEGGVSATICRGGWAGTAQEMSLSLSGSSPAQRVPVQTEATACRAGLGP